MLFCLQSMPKNCYGNQTIFFLIPNINIFDFFKETSCLVNVSLAHQLKAMCPQKSTQVLPKLSQKQRKGVAKSCF